MNTIRGNATGQGWSFIHQCLITRVLMNKDVKVFIIPFKGSKKMNLQKEANVHFCHMGVEEALDIIWGQDSGAIPAWTYQFINSQVGLAPTGHVGFLPTRYGHRLVPYGREAKEANKARLQKYIRDSLPRYHGLEEKIILAVNGHVPTAKAVVEIIPLALYTKNLTPQLVKDCGVWYGAKTTAKALDVVKRLLDEIEEAVHG